MRYIPSTMATQHPDNANIPYWYHRPFISTSAELKECFLTFSELGINEYNWDWEGKFVDEAVVDRLLQKHFAYFQKHPLGEEKFLTFRLPNPRVERQFRLARAFMVMITSSQLAKSHQFSQPPVFETILPLTESAEEIIEIQKAFRDLVSLDHRLLQMEDALPHIEIIPLFEQVSTMLSLKTLLHRYLTLHKKSFGSFPPYLRPYMARSDPALNSGLVPTMLALKSALATCAEVAEETGVGMYPMVGTGSLPFRGGVAPDRIPQVLEEYAGVKTLTVQSAFRYDYPVSQVKQAIKQLDQSLARTKPQTMTEAQRRQIERLIPAFETPYRQTVEALAPLINTMSAFVPRRRERMQHVGLFGYSRGVGNVSLPRAIPFTASLYSLGIPPELIGTGRGLMLAKKNGLWEDNAHWYCHLKTDVEQAGHFLNKTIVAALASRHPEIAGIQEDITGIEQVLGITLGPIDKNHTRHAQIAQSVYDGVQQGKNVSRFIEEGGKIRKSLG